MMRLIEMVVERVEAWFRYSSAAFSSVNITGTYKLYWASPIWCPKLVELPNLTQVQINCTGRLIYGVQDW